MPAASACADGADSRKGAQRTHPPSFESDSRKLTLPSLTNPGGHGKPFFVTDRTKKESSIVPSRKDRLKDSPFLPAALATPPTGSPPSRWGAFAESAVAFRIDAVRPLRFLGSASVTTVVNPQKLKLTIAYDGSAFKGWQSQPFGNTVQDVLEDAFLRVTGGRVVVHGAGRTDTGVHALAQVAHVVVTDRFPPGEWLRILNFNLPPTIRIMKCRPAPPEFHARFSARGKVYRYVIRNRNVVLPHEVNRVWMVPEKLDRDLLRAAAAMFVGRHDFRGFGSNRKAPDRTVRTVSRIQVTERGSLIRLTFHGEGFLYRMVRMLTGSIVRVARGQDDVATVQRRLHEPGQPEWEQVAPARGLHLVKVVY